MENGKQDNENYFFGLGDLIRGAISLYQLSKKHNFKFIVDMQHHPLSLYLKQKSHLHSNLIMENKNNITFVFPDNVENHILKSEESVIFFATNCVFSDPITPDCKKFIKELLTPNNEMSTYIEEKKKIIPFDKYFILHYRLGDYELIRDNSNDDLLVYKAWHLLDQQLEYNTILMSDSIKFKKLIKGNRDIFMFDIDVKHIGYNEHSAHLKDTLFEFFVISQSISIKSNSVYGWGSGFVKIVNNIYDIPLELI